MHKRTYRAYTLRHLDDIAAKGRLSPRRIEQIRAIGRVLPFRVNNYIIEDLIRWEAVPNDPIFQLTFPQPGMLEEHDLSRLMRLGRSEAPSSEINAAAREIQLGLGLPQ